MQYLVEYIDPTIPQENGFAAGRREYLYCYVEADSESAAIAAANEISGVVDAVLTVQNATATALREDRGETWEPEEFAAQVAMGWRLA